MPDHIAEGVAETQEGYLMCPPDVEKLFDNDVDNVKTRKVKKQNG